MTYVLTLFVAMVGGGLGTFLVLSRSTEAAAAKPMKVDPRIVIGDAPPAGKYALIEFIDYQCPPCQTSHEKIIKAKEQFRDKLVITVRNLPLPMHRNAKSAAAEAAREQGRFWPMYKGLMSGKSLDDSEIKSIAHQIGLDQSKFQAAWKGRARARVERDLKDADAIGLNSTPSFLLCKPDGQVLRLQSVEQVSDHLR